MLYIKSQNNKLATHNYMMNDNIGINICMCHKNILSKTNNIILKYTVGCQIHI